MHQDFSSIADLGTVKSAIVDRDTSLGWAVGTFYLWANYYFLVGSSLAHIGNS